MLRVRASVGDVERVAQAVENDSFLSDYTAMPQTSGTKSGPLPYSGTYEYLIITSSDLADEFQPLVEHKISKGLSATLVTTDYIYANFSGIDSAGDNPDKIRDFIRAAYNGWSTEWVLLGGDTDGTDVPAGGPNSVVPHRGCKGGWDSDPGSIDNNMPTDIYFACLDGPWNGDGDSVWGENTDGTNGGEIDLVPEVSLGRAPVSTEAEATNFVNKTILYETVPHPNAKWGVWLGENLAPGLWGGDAKDQIEADCGLTAAPHNWTLTKRYDEIATWTGDDFAGDLNANAHIVNHFGHANTSGNAKLSREDVDALTNTHPYFMYSAGCLSGAFDRANGDSIAEHHVKGEHGAVGVVMNSRVGRTIQQDSANYWLDRNFWYAVFDQNLTQFGEAMDYAKEQLRPGVLAGGIQSRWMYFVCTLFSDPETSLAGGGSPGTLSGSVYEDTNGDGHRNSTDESGLAGADRVPRCQ